MTRIHLIALSALALTVASCGFGDLVPETTSTLAQSGPTPTGSASTTTLVTGEPGLVVVPPGGVDLFTEPGASPFYRPASGLTFPVLSEDGAWLLVLTTCNTERWLMRSDVEVITRSQPATPGPGFDLSEAVIVIDPGHGGRDLGGKGPNGGNEKDVNLAISTFLMARLATGQDIDWETGHVRPGDEYPAVASTWMTRGPSGPEGGDYELGLAYRAGVANGTGADALISIHNNTAHQQTREIPGTDVFYSVSSPGSDRLASLIHEEMIRSLAPFGDDWGAGRVSGPKARVDVDTGEDFYGLLRRADAPAVIVEGMYISNPAEEQLLQSELVQMAYADAVYRGLVRFLTTDRFGSAVLEPDPFQGAVGSPSTASCVVPAQP